MTADFSGSGAAETLTARAKGKFVRLEIRDASGKRLARADAPAPAERHPEIALQTGSIGSAGTLFEVAATGEGMVCRSVWRLRDGALSRLPVQDGASAVPDCEKAAEWTTRWDESRNEPARYLRERLRDTAQGRLHETRAFAFAGFQLERDAGRSGAEVNGVPIPEWYDAEFYAKRELEAFFQRYGFSGLRKAPRLRFEIDRSQGVFALRLRDAQGELRLPVTASKPLTKEEPGVELSAGEPPVHLSVSLARGSIPEDVVVKGAGARFDGSYAPVIHWNPARIRVYPDAEQELATEALPGTWATDGDERVSIETAAAPGAIRFGDVDADIRLEGAPEGADLLLVPRDGSSPAWALALRGPNAMLRIPIHCADGSAGRDCRATGDGQRLKRIGTQLNAR